MAAWKRYLLWTTAIAAVGGFLFLTGEQKEWQKAEAPRPEAPETPGQIGAAFDPYRPQQPKPQAQPASLPVPAASTSPVAPFAPGPYGYRPAPLMLFGGADSGAVPGAPRHFQAGAEVGAVPSAAAGPAAGAAAGASDPLSSRLVADDQGTAVATRLPDRNLFLTDGTPVACIPDAPITSDVEGAFRCKVRDPVLSTSGAVPLLDAGTWLIGRVGGGLRRGQQRLFAVMTRVETPQGCIVRLRAPAADALGQAGLDGEIDTHFFQRFGAYIGMAFLDAGMQAAVLAASNAVGGNRGVSLYQLQTAGRQGGRDLFASDAAIPPTLYRNQAQPIVVRLTQDVDMRPCFRLRLREGVR